MHIAFLLSDLKGGGAQKMVINLANWFAHKGYKTELVLFNNTGKYNNLVADNVAIRNLKTSRTLYGIRPLSHYLKKENPDILFSAIYHVNIIAIFSSLLARTKTKTIVSERNHFTRSLLDKIFLEKVFWSFLLRIFYPFSDYIIGISDGVCDDLKGKLPARAHHKIETIYNPVVTDNFKKNSQRGVKDIFPKSSGVKLITSGRMVLQKDYPTLLKAFQLYQNKNNNAHLVILGDGPLKDELKSLAKKLNIGDNVTFAGFVEEPLAYIKQADIFVMTSAWEGFCNVIVEALFCGLKIVVTDCPSGPSEILKEGQFGTLCTVGNPSSIAKSIENTVEKKVKPEAQKKRALDFHVDSIGEHFLKCFQKVVYQK